MTTPTHISVDDEVALRREQQHVARRITAARPRHYNTLVPDDEAFAALPLDLQFERAIRYKLVLERRMKKLENALARIRRDARKKGVRVDYTVADGRLVNVNLSPETSA